MANDCCKVDYDAHFNADEARRDIQDYHANGAQGSTRRLLEGLIAEGVEAATLLDIGGGVGVVQLELLQAGVASAVDVDASGPFIDVARSEAQARGFGDRTAYRHGDFVALASEVEEADVVTLDRVICCYPDVVRLVSRSAEHARRLYGLVYPVDRWPARMVATVLNFVTRLSGNDYRMHVHRTTQVDQLIRRAGLEPRYHHRGWAWQTAIYARVRPAAEAASSGAS
ncbi:MAG TPA: class I SAM-dependent methyltransferase [Candidatus Limnocylindria bacterium]